jgi:hypothetical protein
MIAGAAADVDGNLRIVPSSHHLVSRARDNVVHTGQSYLDPGTSAEIGTESLYFYDTAHCDFRSEGSAVTRDSTGFWLLS